MILKKGIIISQLKFIFVYKIFLKNTVKKSNIWPPCTVFPSENFVCSVYRCKYILPTQHESIADRQSSGKLDCKINCAIISFHMFIFLLCIYLCKNITLIHLNFEVIDCFKVYCNSTFSPNTHITRALIKLDFNKLLNFKTSKNSYILSIFQLVS